MADVRIEHIYNCDENTFWDKIFLDDEYNSRLFKDALEFPTYEVVKSEDTGDQVKRTINVVPKLGPMPAPVKKLVGDGLGYTENGTLDKQRRRYSIKITTNKLADKIDIHGDLWTEPAGDKKLKRIFEGKVSVKVFGIGGMVEKQIVGDLTSSYEKGAAFTNKFISEKGL